MFNNLNNDNIIFKSEMYQKLMAESILNDCFAKTVNYYGIHSKFCLDTPEIIESERKAQEKKSDIQRFTKLMMTEIENDTDKARLEQLEKYDNLFVELSENKNLLHDLNLL